MSRKPLPDKIVVATHRKARHHYEILEVYEAGLALLGSEVKSLRGGQAVLDGCFGRPEGGELFLYNLYIPPYGFTTVDPPDSRRPRKLLLRRPEIARIQGRLQTKGLTLVPLEIYFKKGWAKVAIAVGKGKRGPDKRADLKKKDLAREAEKSFKGRYKG